MNEELKVFMPNKEDRERELFLTAAQHAINFRKGLRDRAPKPTMRAHTLGAIMGGETPEQPEDATTVINELVSSADAGLMGSAGGRFFGWVIGASHPAGVAADWLTSVWGQNAGNFHVSPASAMAEKAASGWLLDILNLPRDSSVGFVTGATMANFTCLAAARSEVLSRVGWNVEEEGLNGAPVINVFIGADAHTTVLNALQYLGIGRNKAIKIATDDQGRMLASSLKAKMEQVVGPKIVIAQAGQINTGAMDPFADIVNICHGAGAWLHVDGAFGLWANACPDLQSMTKGLEKANSWATDGHKWLQLPYDSGFAIVQNSTALRRAMNISASYLPKANSAEYEAGDFVPELSRRARGFAAWAVIKALGRKGIIKMVMRHCGFARSLGENLSKVPGIKVLNEVSLNQVILNFGTDEDVATRDVLTNEVIRLIQEKNKVLVEGANWHGERVMRVSVISEPTEQADMDLLESEICEAWKQISQIQKNLLQSS